MKNAEDVYVPMLLIIEFRNTKKKKTKNMSY